MDSQNKSLQAACAEALGWHGVKDRGDGLLIGVETAGEGYKEVPAYGKSACSTGPLIERFRIEVIPARFGVAGAPFVNGWGARQEEKFTTEPVERELALAPTPWEAVGKLIVLLADKGKLKTNG